MIITKTPFRMSFFGGGTDMPAFFNEYGGAVISTTFGEFRGNALAIQYIDDFKSVPNLLISLCVFYYLIRVDIGKSKCINWFAGSAFAVYIVHQTPNFYEILWNEIFKVPSWIGSDWLVLYLFTFVLLTYILTVSIDQVRKKYFEPIWTRSRVFVLLNKELYGQYKVISTEKK